MNNSIDWVIHCLTVTKTMCPNMPQDKFRRHILVACKRNNLSKAEFHQVLKHFNLSVKPR